MRGYTSSFYINEKGPKISTASSIMAGTFCLRRILFTANVAITKSPSFCAKRVKAQSKSRLTWPDLVRDERTSRVSFEKKRTKQEISQIMPILSERSNICCAGVANVKSKSACPKHVRGRRTSFSIALLCPCQTLRPAVVWKMVWLLFSSLKRIGSVFRSELSSCSQEVCTIFIVQ